jgi:hypothetical protein
MDQDRMGTGVVPLAQLSQQQRCVPYTGTQAFFQMQLERIELTGVCLPQCVFRYDTWSK